MSLTEVSTERVIALARNILGSLSLPGDKSISHLCALLGDHGTTRLANFSTGADCASSLARVEALGARVTRGNAGTIEIEGVTGNFHSTNKPLDGGNSGSTMRILASQQSSFTLTGDASLSSRPMERIRKPLT